MSAAAAPTSVEYGQLEPPTLDAAIFGGCLALAYLLAQKTAPEPPPEPPSA